MRVNEMPPTEPERIEHTARFLVSGVSTSEQAIRAVITRHIEDSTLPSTPEQRRASSFRAWRKADSAPGRWIVEAKVNPMNI